MTVTGLGNDSLEKLQTAPLRELVYRRLKQRILSHQWRPGHQIVIDQIASELGVSHTPVREALAMLELDGLVTMRHYKNPRVSNIETSDVRDVYQMRILLEAWAAGEACGQLPDEKLDEIEEMLLRARHEVAEGYFETHLQADLRLHDLIISSTSNALFQRLAKTVTDQSVRIRALAEVMRGPEAVPGIIEEHLGILAALKSGDCDLARACVVAHLESAMQRTLVALEGMDKEE